MADRAFDCAYYNNNYCEIGAINLPKIEMMKSGDLIPYFFNPRHNDSAVDMVAESIKEFGFKNPIIVDKDLVIIAGHTRLKAAQKLGFDEVPVIIADDLTEDQARAFRLVDNRTAEIAEWDFEKLQSEIENIELDLSAFDFNFDELQTDEQKEDIEHSTLDEKFIFSPFSVLDGRMKKWQERKRQWIEQGIDSIEGRDNDLMSGLRQCADKYKNGGKSGLSLKGTSVFDPVICELMMKWFAPYQGSIFDPFAGGSVRGIIAALLGHDYTGIDLRAEQVEANERQADALGVAPCWICDDSRNADKYIDDESVDFVFSCPPYADLEVYSDDPRDLSTMEYDDFLQAYREIIEISVRKLKKDRFAVFVVGDVRDKKGFYRDFISDTKSAFIDAGAGLYNEIIKLDALATAPVRAALLFKNRKVVKVHQNILVFYKGDPANIRLHFGEIEAGDVSDYQREPNIEE